MTRVRFPAYRSYRESLITVSDSLMAMLIGTRLGEHALRNSPADPSAHLPDLFGRIPGIERVNRKVGDAAQLLQEAEHHIAAMGIPYVLGVHGAFLSHVVQMLRDDGKDDSTVGWAVQWRPDPNDIPLSEMHDYIAERCQQTLPADLLELFGFARRVRNRIIHFAGNAGSRLPREYKALTPTSRARWESITGRPLSVDQRGRIELLEGELVATLATTRHLAAVVNEMLVGELSREYWAALVVGDYRSLEPQRFGEQPKRLRRIKGHSRLYYGPIGLTEAELAAALS